MEIPYIFSYKPRAFHFPNSLSVCKSVMCKYAIMWVSSYFLGYKMEFVFVFFLNNPKTLTSSYKMDLDLWDCLGKVKLVL